MSSHRVTGGWLPARYYVPIENRHEQFGWDGITTASYQDMREMRDLYLDIWVGIGHNKHLGLKHKHRA